MSAHIISWPLARCLASALAITLALTPACSASAAHAKASLPVIEREVMCVSCKIPLQVAQSPQADRERALIGKLIQQGDSPAQIRRQLVEQYGSAVLGMPSSDGFDLAAYLVPIIAALVLLVTLVALLVIWRGAAASSRSSSEPPPAPLASADAARLEEDLARHER
jgi:cytochrome c-type biogenesis protein CcmH